MAATIEWSREHLESLQPNGIPETQYVEYKQEVPSRTGDGSLDQREEFLKDVTGMANGGGGVILYGVTNQGAILSLKDAKPETFDKLEQRLGQWIDVGVEPRLHGVSFEKIDVADGYVLLLRVPNTLAGPFWAKVPGPSGNAESGKRMFKIRRGTRVIDMSYQEVREAFDRNARVLVAAQQWVQTRIERLAMGFGEAVLLVHIIPLSTYERGTEPLAISDLKRHEITLMPIFGDRLSGLVNFDGYRLYGDSPFNPPYVQTFRNGSLEVASYVSFPDSSGNANASAWSISETTLADHCWDAVQSGVRYSRLINGSTSAMLCVTLCGTTSARLQRTHISTRACDRNLLAVPPMLVETFTTSEAEQLTKRALDMLVQGFGYNRCVMFDEGGAWKGDWNHLGFSRD